LYASIEPFGGLLTRQASCSRNRTEGGYRKA
jgi:hypothetical protein